MAGLREAGGEGMNEYRFRVTIEGADVLSDAAQDALHLAGCSDATFGSSEGVQTTEFDREAPIFQRPWQALSGRSKARSRERV